MRIFHTIDSAGLYGAEAVLLGLAGEQMRRGDHPTIVSIAPSGSAERPIEAASREAGIPLIPFRMADGLNARGARHLLSTLAEKSADVIHSHGYKTNILFSIFGRAIGQAPRVTTLHGWTARKGLSRLGAYRFLDRLCLRGLDAVAVVDRTMLGVPAVSKLGSDRVSFIPNGLADSSNSRVRLSDTLPDDLLESMNRLRNSGRIVIGAIGRLSTEKNVRLLLQLMRETKAASPPLHLVIVGEGPEEPALRQWVLENDLGGCVTFAGYRAEARKYLPAMDVLAIPSLTEGLPMTLLEAMAAETPVVATNVGEISSVLEKDGRIVPPGDAGAFRAALVETIQDLPGARSRATLARTRITSQYSVGIMAERYAAFYAKALELRGIR